MREYRRSTAVRTTGLICTLLAVLTVSCRPPAQEPSSQAGLAVTVAIPPQAFLVERIGGEFVDVQVLVEPGQSPHTFEPTPQQMSRLSRSRIYFKMGLPFEDRLVARVSKTLRELTIVDVREGVQLRRMEEWEGGCDEDHEHGHDHGHEHAGELDPHIWLSPKLAKIQAGTVHGELCRLDPARSADYDRNLRALEADLDEVDQRIAAMLAPLRRQEIYVFHPAFGYFADAYGLRQVAVETGGKQPGAKQLAELIKRARDSGVRVIFVQRQFPIASAEAVAQAIGGSVVAIDPLARDYLVNLDEMASKIAAAAAGPAEKD